ncbi:MAG: phosphoribosylformylglycinamidine cyclo-ligase [Truepera sp.]|nr:phosphoribosylformylglycinamidine cyclo-ligase [Truepera sp.]
MNQELNQERRYQSAGVDLRAKAEALALITQAVKSTYTPEVLAGIGAFGGLYQATALQGLVEPVLVASTDGVGTKTKLATALGRYHSIGYDIVHHCINDILVQGARPLFFLDYLAAARLQPQIVAQIVTGVADACRTHGMALLGGETAEMPGVYAPDEFDLVGTIVGVVERRAIIDGSSVEAGDQLIALMSGGLQTNGYSLARAVLGSALNEPFEGHTVGEALLMPHRCYLPAVAPLLSQGIIKGMAHITGGGIPNNLPRILPAGLGATINLGSWPVPAIFELIAVHGAVSQAEMFEVFNMGAGFLLVVGAQDAAPVAAQLEGYVVGEIVGGEGVRLL